MVTVRVAVCGRCRIRHLTLFDDQREKLTNTNDVLSISYTKQAGQASTGEGIAPKVYAEKGDLRDAPRRYLYSCTLPLPIPVNRRAIL